MDDVHCDPMIRMLLMLRLIMEFFMEYFLPYLMGEILEDNVGTFWQSCHMKMLVFICRDDLVVAEKLSCSMVAGTEQRNTFKIIMRLKIEIISDRRRINQTRCSPGEFDWVQIFFRLLDHRMLWKNFELWCWTLGGLTRRRWSWVPRSRHRWHWSGDGRLHGIPVHNTGSSTVFLPNRRTF